MATTNTYRFTAPSRADTPRLAREWVALVLQAAGLAHLVDRARLCTSEVVTNAHVHTRSRRISVEVALATGSPVTVTVYDQAPAVAATLAAISGTPAGDLATHGRGLGLLAAYADDWAVTARPGRKAVWFRLA
ncbi:ATP-binding protein [Streptomyces sp. NPDC032472]|uniref:ATP-binding protein n=1 Tax=Streptomyces sp. NPDC032472 TaxID=3155018 RepID=UPI0033D565DC